MRATLRWAIIACAAATGLLAQTKPTDPEVKQAISKTVKGKSVDFSSALFPASSMAGVGYMGMGVRVAAVQSVEITRSGTYNERDGYWPVEACVTVMARADSLGGADPPAERVSALMRFRVKGDDFGDWVATEIPIASNQPMGSFVCQPKNRVGAAAEVGGGNTRGKSGAATAPPARPASANDRGESPAPDPVEAALKAQLSRNPSAIGKYTVRHAHSGATLLATGQWPSCIGVLFVFGDHLEYATVSDSDGQRHPFVAQSNEITQVAVNRLPIGEFPAFHVTLVDKRNFNFVSTEDRRVIVGAAQSILAR